jgi:hypothetical protein
MSRRQLVRPALGFLLISLMVLALAPAVLVAGELVNRYYLRGRRMCPARVLPYRLPRLVRRRSPAAAERRYRRYADSG